jgi:hypothetical protein
MTTLTRRAFNFGLMLSSLFLGGWTQGGSLPGNALTTDTGIALTDSSGDLLTSS